MQGILYYTKSSIALGLVVATKLLPATNMVNGKENINDEVFNHE